MKEFERSRNDLKKTQDIIQELSKSILPLDIAASHAQEDTGIMSKEHVDWRNQVNMISQELKGNYENQMVYMDKINAAKIQQLERDVEQKKSQIRAQIYQNIIQEQRLQALTAAIVL